MASGYLLCENSSGFQQLLVRHTRQPGEPKVPDYLLNFRAPPIARLVNPKWSIKTAERTPFHLHREGAGFFVLRTPIACRRRAKKKDSTMSNQYTDLKTHNTTTPQTEQADPHQVKNHAGGYVFPVSAGTTLRRFLVLGTTEGTYYAGPAKHTEEAFDALKAALAELRVAFIDIIVEISDKGRAKSNTEAILALALATGAKNTDGTPDAEVRSAALAAMPQVVRTGTHLFEFVAFTKNFRGGGRGLSTAIKNWYLNRTPEQVAYQVSKYQKRTVGTTRMSHRLVLGLYRPKTTEGSGHSQVFKWAVGKAVDDEGNRVPTGNALLDAVDAVRADPSLAPELITKHRLSWEVLPSESLALPETWEALLPHMGLMALVRNLGRLTSLGVVGSNRAAIVARLTDTGAIMEARLHPMAILLALTTYAQGHGTKGAMTWVPDPKVTDALDEAFRLAFKTVEPTGKRRLIALDVSGSMAWSGIGGSTLSPRDASAALALIALSTDDDVDVVAFSHELTPLGLSSRQRLDDVIKTISNFPFGATDCSLPMTWALKKGYLYDSFEIYTDNETWYGPVHPHEALETYRRKTGIADAKLVVNAMTATDFSIANPSDPNTLDVVGFDSAAPALVSDFIRGDI